MNIGEYGWRVYSNAIIPTVPPHEAPDLSVLENNEVWNIAGSPLLARYTTDFDCGTETNWWYVIKDTPFDISDLKAKRRYVINKGLKNFEVRRIEPLDYAEEIWFVAVEAFAAYPEKYRPVLNKEKFMQDVASWKESIVYGAFFKDDNKMCGYAVLNAQGEKCLAFDIEKTIPKYEGYEVNAAIVAQILSDLREFLSEGGYICDGARSINHETNFQNYLEKYFGFRKAYCRMHIKYNPKIKPIIKILYLIRRPLMMLDNVSIVHKVNAVLKMEAIARGAI